MIRYPLRDRVVFLTGAGRGVGAATARALVRRGARVAAVDLDLGSARTVVDDLPGGSAVALGCDVTDIASVRAAVTDATAALGPVDVAIANAGILGTNGRLKTSAPEEIEQVLSVNVSGAVNTALATMDTVTARQGQFAVISSVFAAINGAAALPYAMSKAAVEKLGQGLAVELAAHGASAMTVYFSLVDTPMIHDGVDAHPEVSRMLAAAAPKPLLVRITADAAAAAIVDGLERRAQRVVAPGRWGPVLAARGVLGPVTDRRLAADRRVGALLDGIDSARRGRSVVR